MNKDRKKEDGELNVTAMLDMAFQLLAFFVLTFRSPASEEQLFLKLPPPVPITIGPHPDVTDIEGRTERSADVRTTRSVVVQVLDNNGDGSIATVKVGDPSINPKLKEVAMNSLPDEFRGYFKCKGAGDAGGQKASTAGNYEQMVIQSTPTLRWEEVLKIADKCTGLSTIEEDKMPAISFSCLQPEADHGD